MGLVGGFFDGVQVLNEVLRVENLACEEALERNLVIEDRFGSSICQSQKRPTKTKERGSRSRYILDSFGLTLPNPNQKS